MAKDQDKGGQPAKITAMYKVAYSFQAPNGNALRTGALLIRADSPIGARVAAQAQLVKEYDWYKIGKIIEYNGDHPQQSL